MAKPKVGFYWCASCGGCEEAIVDLAEDILPITEAVDLVFWPVALDFKKSDVLAMEDRSMAAVFINGAVRTSEQQEMARLLRAKSRLVIAFGACAQLGGISGLANQFSRDFILRSVYDDAPTVVNENHVRPVASCVDHGRTLTLPEFRNVVRTLEQIVSVDYYLPGCPPTPKLIKSALAALLANSLPAPGSVLAPDVALCDQCPRKKSKPENIQYTVFKRPHLTALDSELCFLAQGVICIGPATRGGCEALCPAANMPCTGCFGPTSRICDQGAKMLSCLSAAVEAKEPEPVESVLAGIPDPVGTFYRYALPASLLRFNTSVGIGADKEHL
jgi:F420-non-reducing hydrogenase small subunit